ncbi:alpha-L-fucosidase [Niabella insulamsoli]|uniref:alpha-L-fucosidase n=1 Tax=Niabella insulamsoli TaxID=3144874 RepID=UPI0031FCBA10
MKVQISILGILFCLLSSAQVPLPTTSQMGWQEAEIGVLVSYDLHVADGQKYNQARNRITPIEDYNIFYPEALDTDQWVKAAKAGGATFAVLTVTHETGFALYQSDVNPYSMKILKWKNGKGDIVRDFVNSCRKYNIKPGLYLGIRWNAFLGVHDFIIEGDSRFVKNRQQAYKRMCEGMVEEITTRYGDLFMVWFDGGASDPKTYGADVMPIVVRNQPGALFYHNAQRADFRWGGSESGTVPYPCWSTFTFPSFVDPAYSKESYKDNFKLLKHGDVDGKYYMPAMSDAPLRGFNGRHEWFWEPDDVSHIYPVSSLVNMYRNSVGHNSTLIIGLTPNPKGLLDQADVDTLSAFGRQIKALFGNPVAVVKDSRQREVSLQIPRGASVKNVIIQEGLAGGQKIRKFDLLGYRKGKWERLFSGSSIGHKLIWELPKEHRLEKIKLHITDAVGTPDIRQFGLY